MSIRHHTSNPGLWRSYWGGFDYGPNKDCITEFIITNRNLLAIHYKLKAFTHTPIAELYGYELDHVEAYRTFDGKIVVFFSNYSCPVMPKIAIDLEFKSHCKLYHEDADTYIRVFQSRKDMNSAVKALKERMKAE